jgi:DNA-binding response OmpR family regulator
MSTIDRIIDCARKVADHPGEVSRLVDLRLALRDHDRLHCAFYDVDRRVLLGRKGCCHLPTKRAQLLEALARRAGLIVSREAIYMHMWGDRPDGGPTDKNIDVQLTRLRREIVEVDAPIAIHTEWGFGYRLEMTGAPAGAA